MAENGNNWTDKKITRRDFLKKAGMTSAGAVVGASAIGGFFANKVRKISVKLLMVMKKSAFTEEHLSRNQLR